MNTLFTDDMYIESVLAIYPNVRGFGYAVFLEENNPKDYGIAIIKPRTKEKYLDRIKIMVKVQNPSIILLPTPTGKYNRKRERIQSLIEDIEQYAKAHNIHVKKYSREQIRTVFEQFDAYSKVQIAEKICMWMPDLEDKRPALRKLYMTEDYHQGMFDAISLVITHNFLTS